jgi:hypothetical protein
MQPFLCKNSVKNYWCFYEARRAHGRNYARSSVIRIVGATAVWGASDRGAGAIETMTFAETVVVLDAVVLRQRSLLSEKV